MSDVNVLYSPPPETEDGIGLCAWCDRAFDVDELVNDKDGDFICPLCLKEDPDRKSRVKL
jgi:hypothetical protein